MVLLPESPPELRHKSIAKLTSSWDPHLHLTTFKNSIFFKMDISKTAWINACLPHYSWIPGPQMILKRQDTSVVHQTLAILKKIPLDIHKKLADMYKSAHCQFLRTEYNQDQTFLSNQGRLWPSKSTWELQEQAFINCVHGYHHARNVHSNSIAHTQKFVHGIDSSV